jgi:hypothetical protein
MRTRGSGRRKFKRAFKVAGSPFRVAGSPSEFRKPRALPKVISNSFGSLDHRDFGPRDTGRDLALKTCHLDATDATRRDMGECGEGFISYVQREAVHADPTPDADADARKLPIANPYTRESVHSPGLYAETGTDIEQKVFDGAQVDVQVLSALTQVEDGVTDELAWAVIGCLSATIGDMDWMRQRRGFSQAGLIRGASNGVYGLVFEEEEVIRLGGIRDLSFDNFLLQREAVRIGDSSEPFGAESGGREQCA